MKGHPRAQRGFTILEVLIAAMLLGVAAVVVFSAFGIGLRAAALAGAMNTATALAQDGLAAASNSPCVPARRLLAAERWDERLGSYTRQVLVYPLSDGGVAELTATVSWKQGGRPHSVTLKTLRYSSAPCRHLGN